MYIFVKTDAFYIWNFSVFVLDHFCGGFDVVFMFGAYV